MIVARLSFAHTWLCPGIFVPQHELWPDTIMTMDYYNNCVHKIMGQLYWCKYRYTKVLWSKRSEMWLFNWILHAQLSPALFLLKYFVNFIFPILNIGTLVWLWPGLLLLCIWAQSCMCTIVWVESCMGTDESGHQRAWS